jgi:hypothetical protein
MTPRSCCHVVWYGYTHVNCELLNPLLTADCSSAPLHVTEEKFIWIHDIYTISPLYHLLTGYTTPT